MKINDLIKHRSVTACMKEAYSLMTGNVKNLLKSTWWAFMIYAFMVAFMVYLRTPNKMLHDWGEENLMLSFCLQTVVYLGVIVAAFLMGAAAWRWLTDKPFGRMLKRFTTIYLASAVVSFVVTFAATFALTCFYLTAFSQPQARLLQQIRLQAHPRSSSSCSLHSPSSLPPPSAWR